MTQNRLVCSRSLNSNDSKLWFLFKTFIFDHLAKQNELNLSCPPKFFFSIKRIFLMRYNLFKDML